MEEKNVIKLAEEFLIGKGYHKAAYIHPQNPKLCIKVPFSMPDTDVEKELKYREALCKKHRNPSMLTEYYGMVETDKGPGFVYELLRDYDGKISKSLKELFEDKALLKEHLGVGGIEVMEKFRQLWFQEKVVTSDVDFVNFFAQKLSPRSFTIRIIDNIGTSSHLPLAYYFDFLAGKHAEKYWRRLIEAYRVEYSVPEEQERLKELL